jgi:hypothetical protein
LSSVVAGDTPKTQSSGVPVNLVTSMLGNLTVAGLPRPFSCVAGAGVVDVALEHALARGGALALGGAGLGGQYQLVGHAPFAVQVEELGLRVSAFADDVVDDTVAQRRGGGALLANDADTSVPLRTT